MNTAGGRASDALHIHLSESVPASTMPVALSWGGTAALPSKSLAQAQPSFRALVLDHALSGNRPPTTVLNKQPASHDADSAQPASAATVAPPRSKSQPARPYAPHRAARSEMKNTVRKARMSASPQPGPIAEVVQAVPLRTLNADLTRAHNPPAQISPIPQALRNTGSVHEPNHSGVDVLPPPLVFQGIAGASEASLQTSQTASVLRPKVEAAIGFQHPSTPPQPANALAIVASTEDRRPVQTTHPDVQPLGSSDGLLNVIPAREAEPAHGAASMAEVNRAYPIEVPEQSSGGTRIEWTQRPPQTGSASSPKAVAADPSSGLRSTSTQARSASGTPRASITEKAESRPQRSMGGVQVVSRQPNTGDMFPPLPRTSGALAQNLETAQGAKMPGSEAAQRTARDTFAEMDTETAVQPTWNHAGVNKAEAGFHDPSLGWVTVRAQLGSAGVHATVVPASGVAGQTISDRLTSLGTYLTDHHTHIDSWAVVAPENSQMTPGAFQHGEAIGQGTGGQGRGSGQLERRADEAPPSSTESLAAGKESEELAGMEVRNAETGRYISLTA